MCVWVGVFDFVIHIPYLLASSNCVENDCVMNDPYEIKSDTL